MHRTGLWTVTCACHIPFCHMRFKQLVQDNLVISKAVVKFQLASKEPFIVMRKIKVQHISGFNIANEY